MQMKRKFFMLLSLTFISTQIYAINLDLKDLCPQVENIQYGMEDGKHYAFAYNSAGKYFKTVLLTYPPLMQWLQSVKHYPENKQLTCTYRGYTTSHPVNTLTNTGDY